MNYFKKCIFLFIILISATPNNLGQNSGTNHWVSYKLDLTTYPSCISLDKENNIYVGTDDGQVLKSDDNGNSFEQIFESESHDPISCILITSYGKIYVGVSYPGGCMVVSSGNEGVYESSYCGNNWMRIIKTVWVNSIIENKNGEVFVCANNSNLVTDNYISKDKGKSWQNLNNGLPEDFITEFYLDKFNDLYAIEFHGSIYKLDFVKFEWKKKSDNVPIKYLSNFARTSNGIEFISDSESGLFKSSDNFNTYSKINSTLNLSISPILINSADEIYISVNNHGVFCSKDLGDSWNEFNKSPGSNYFGSMFFDKEEYLYVLGYSYEKENNSEEIYNLISDDRVLKELVLYKTNKPTTSDDF